MDSRFDRAWASAAVIAVLCAICSILLALSAPRSALALNSAEARAEFSDSELSRLFVEVEYPEQSEFVLRDVDAGESKYLAIRSVYRDRYEDLAGDDSVGILGGGLDSRGVIGGHDLEMVADPSSAPWCNVLHLLSHYETLAKEGLGTAFMVSDHIAVTAAHCVYDQGSFADRLYAQSGYDSFDATSGICGADYVLIPRLWADSAGAGTDDADSNYDQDWAVLIFGSNPPGTDPNAFFSYESISVFDSFAYGVNCAGYSRVPSEGSSTHLYTNDQWGNISIWDPHPLGNSFRVNLSTVPGMSGGPVYCQLGDGSYVAVGINSAELPVGDSYVNYACRITERLQVIVAWAEEYGYVNTEDSSGSGGQGGGGVHSPAAGGEALGGSGAGTPSDALLAAMGSEGW